MIAHRGASAGAVDNSLDAFARAIEVGADLIEFDLRRTRDEQLIAFHDRVVRGVPVSRLSRDEITAKIGHQPPLLDEVLDLARGRIGLDVELKEAGYTDRVIDALSKRFEPERVLVTSFIDEVVAEAKHLTSASTVGLLVGIDRPRPVVRTRLSELDPVRRARACGADYVVMHFTLAELGALRRAHRAGFPAIVWTVNDAARLRRYLGDERVTAVVTDVPARAIQLRAEA